MKESILSIKLKEYREEYKLTQRELAEYLGVSDKSISKWELGQTYPNKTNMLQLSKKIGISVETLLLDEMAEERSGKEYRVQPNKMRWLLLAALAIICVLAGTTFKMRANLQAQVARVSQLETQVKTANQQTYDYRVSVVMALVKNDLALKTFRRYVETNFEVSDFTEMAAYPDKDRKVMIQTFVIQAQNNDQMRMFCDQIKAQVPNYLNLESAYL